MSSEYPKGSEWRKWDLHVHTASSFDAYQGDDADKLLVEAWREHGFAAVAITDHHRIDCERIFRLRELAPEITIFPGFEIRTDSASPNLHLIAIFPETKDINVLRDDFESQLIRRHSRDNENDQNKFRSISEIVDFTKRQGGILTIHAGRKENGIDREITNALPVKQAIKEDIVKDIDIFEVGQIKDIEEYKKEVLPDIGEKPVILCSDNHDPRNYQLKETLWVKADPTFQGLIQAILQPFERVFVGNLPPKLDHVNKNKQFFIQNISVSRVGNPRFGRENWFDTSLDLNPSLVAIIGNKGSGKSALSDIIGYVCQSKNITAASFLTKERFRKIPENKANDYAASICWFDGENRSNISLADSANGTPIIEEAQYLPQRYIEKVCNDLEKEFQKEIDNVIFSYVDSSERGDTSNLEELIELKSKPMQVRAEEIKLQLKMFNEEIVRLEIRLSKSHKKETEEKLQQQRNHLERHEKNKPVEVIKPSNEPDADYQRKLETTKNKIKELVPRQLQICG